uniref:Fibronectin type-III domain-containing protein n=1 Tax=Hucho hucho TaxID=62062 RepID=A0A4W5MK21_9TELE
MQSQIFVRFVYDSLRWTESLLPQPQNVEVVSYNMDAIVKWDAPLTSLTNLTYTAEYRMPSTAFFHTVCKATKEHRCDFGKLPSCHGNYQFRVRIELEGNTSSWEETPNFSLKKGTVIGPPNVTLVTKGGAIGAVEVNIQNPVLKISSLKEAYSKVQYNIRYWKKTDKKDVRATYNSQTQINTHTHTYRTWTLQGVESVPQGCWPMLTPMLPTVVSIPATEKHPQNMMLESCLSWSESPLGVFWQTPSGLSCALPFTEEGLPYGHSTINTCLVEC